jgi:beta-aspartyl-peptidase (threonine type)
MRTFTLLLAAALVACRAGDRPAATATASADSVALQNQMTSQLTRSAADWNRGDLEGFLSDYAAESTTTFVDGRRARHGIGFIRENYTRWFAPGAQRDSLRFEAVETRRLGPEFALVTARFILHRDDSTTASGPFTLVMRQTPQGWKIIHDHSSRDPR